jgi:hypothetical protein
VLCEMNTNFAGQQMHIRTSRKLNPHSRKRTAGEMQDILQSH